MTEYNTAPSGDAAPSASPADWKDLKDIPTARLVLLAAALRKEANLLNGPLRLSEALPPDAPLIDQIPEPALTWEG